MVDFDRLTHISHSTSMLAVLDYYNIDYINNGNDRYKCVCPFHNDHDPSLVIYTSENHTNESFCCYVDNTAGDPFHFVRLMEGGDFKQAWSVLCHINNISDAEADQVSLIDNIIRESSNSYQEKRSMNLINYQISRMYFKLYEDLKASFPKDQSELTTFIDERLKNLDNYLESSVSYADLHQYMKMEINKIKQFHTSHFKKETSYK